MKKWSAWGLSLLFNIVSLIATIYLMKFKLPSVENGIVIIGLFLILHSAIGYLLIIFGRHFGNNTEKSIWISVFSGILITDFIYFIFRMILAVYQLHWSVLRFFKESTCWKLLIYEIAYFGVILFWREFIDFIILIADDTKTIPLKPRTGVKIYFVIEIITTVLTCDFWIIRYFMKLSDLYFRSSIEVVGQFMTWIVLPCMLLIQIILMAQRKQKNNRRICKTILLNGLSVLCGFGIAAIIIVVGFFFILLLDSSFENEHMLNARFIDGTTQEFLGAIDDKHHIYYEPCYGIMKRKINDEPCIIENILEYRYHEKFEIAAKIKGKTTYYDVTEKDNQENKFRVILSPIYNECTDNYDTILAKKILQKMLEEKEINREYDVKTEYNTNGLLRDTIVFSCKGYKDIQNLTEDISLFSKELLNASTLNNHNWNVKLAVRCEEQKDGRWYAKRELDTLNFGNKYSWGYFDPDTLQMKIYQNVEFYYKNQARFDDIIEDSELEKEEKIESERKENIYESESSVVAQPVYDAENDITTPEGAFQVLYDSAFEGENKKKETTYNAKGNFYAVLGNGIEIVDGERMTTVETVVYNGLSENGKCHIFVQYMEYYYPSGEQGNTKIIDFYAIDKKTKQVVKADKHGWAETGSKEYQEMTK